MKKNIAIPTENGLLCTHFGHCEKFVFIQVENGKISHFTEKTPPEHIPGLYPKWVAQFGVTDVIAGGMGQKAIELFNDQSINVFVGAPVKSPENLVLDFIADKLKLEANYCNHDHNEIRNC